MGGSRRVVRRCLDGRLSKFKTPPREVFQGNAATNGEPNLAATDVTICFYPVPLHLQECYETLGYHKGDFPVAEQAAQEVLSLPIYPELTHDQLVYVVQTINQFFTQ